MAEETVDIAVVGAGAAGLMAAIWAARRGRREGRSVMLLDSREKIGAKILISGGTRCNVTNRKVTPEDYQGGPKHIIKHVLESFTPTQTIEFFREIGVELVLEPTGKYFPVTHSGKTVLEALMKECRERGVNLVRSAKVEKIQKQGEFFDIYLSSRAACAFRARRLILATGGLSYPETGSDGTGFKIASALSHVVNPTRPSLTPLTTVDPDWTALSGITLEAELYFYEMGRKKAEARGSFLFTHVGYSGPSSLDISRHVAFAEKGSFEVFANFLPGFTHEALSSEMEFDKSSVKRLKNYFAEKYALPARFIEVFLKKMGYDPEEKLKDLKAAVRKKLIHHLLHAPLRVDGVLGYKKAEATAGGVDLKEIRVQTMESKKTEGLYFAGEILDVDGRIGGFNFQWAWSSGALAGRSAAESFR